MSDGRGGRSRGAGGGRPETGRSAVESIDGGARAGAEDRTQFAVSTRSFLQDQIGLADSKAGAVSTISILFLAYVVRVGAGPGGVGQLSTTSLEPWLLVGGLLALGTGVALALSVVVPRIAGHPDGLVFWQAILEYPTADEYAEAVGSLEPEEIAAGLLRDCHRLSEVCERKFAVLRWAMGAASLGLLLSLLWLLLY